MSNQTSKQTKRARKRSRRQLGQPEGVATREAPAKQRPQTVIIPAARRALVYHGTTERAVKAITRTGLLAMNGIRPFVTIELERAAGYGLRAVCADLVERGLVDEPEHAQRFAVLELTVDRNALTVDPAHQGDHVLQRCPSAWVGKAHVFDAAEHMPSREEILMYARLKRAARQLESGWQHARVAAVGT